MHAVSKPQPLPSNHPYQDIRRAELAPKDRTGGHKSGLVKWRRSVAAVLITLAGLASVAAAASYWLQSIVNESEVIASTAASSLNQTEFEGWFYLSLRGAGYEGPQEPMDSVAARIAVTDLYDQILGVVLVDPALGIQWDVSQLLPTSLAGQIVASGGTTSDMAVEAGMVTELLRSVIAMGPIYLGAAVVFAVAAVVVAKDSGARGVGWVLRRFGLRLASGATVFVVGLLWYAHQLESRVYPLTEEGLMYHLTAGVISYNPGAFVYLAVAGLSLTGVGLSLRQRR